jgi:hypothetical protein
MIAFGTSMVDPEAYRRYARPGIELAREADSEVYAFAALGSISRSYNLVLEQAAALDGLEALVLVHEHAEITDAEFAAKVRAALADPDVGVVGCLGATGVETVAWWEGAVNGGTVAQRYTAYGGGEFEAYGWARTSTPPAEVETVDGFLLVLSPWAVRNLRFDESIHLGTGFDLDLCAQVRAAGRKVVTAAIDAVHHRPVKLLDDHELWTEAHIDYAERHAPQLAEAEWKARARRSEAERDAARAHAYSNHALLEARLAPLHRELEAMTDTFSWRLTAPLRRLNARRKGV